MFSVLRCLPRSGIIGFYGYSVFNFLRNQQTFPKRLYHFTFLPAMDEDSICSTFLPTLFIACLFNCSHVSRNEIVSHCGYIYISLVTNDVLFVYPFVYLWFLFICISFLEKCLFRSLAHF